MRVYFEVSAPLTILHANQDIYRQEGIHQMYKWMDGMLEKSLVAHPQGLISSITVISQAMSVNYSITLMAFDI